MEEFRILLINTLNTNRYKNHIKILFWIILASLLYITLTPTPPKLINLHNIDKLYHFVAFAGFATAFKMDYSKLDTWLIVLFTTILGCAIEFAQIYIPGRGFSVVDFVADVIGGITGAYVTNYLIAKINKNIGHK